MSTVKFDSRQVIFNKSVPIDYFTVMVSKESNRKLITEFEPTTNAEWATYVKDMRKKNVDVWNNKLYRLENIEEIRNGSRKLTISPDFDFAHSRVMKEFEGKGYSEECCSNNIATIGIVTTSDGFTVWEFRTQTSNANQITPLGGALQPEQIEVKEFTDFYENFLIEIEEEGNILKSEINDKKLFAIIRFSDFSSVLFCYHVKLNLTKKEMDAKLQESLKKGESESFKLVHLDELKQFREEDLGNSSIGLMVDLFLAN